MLMMSTGRSTTQTMAASRRASEQIAHGLSSVRAPQIPQARMRSRAWVSAAANWRTSAASLCTMCMARRSAVRGPIPGSLLRAATRSRIGCGREDNEQWSSEAGNAEPGGELAHLTVGNFFGLGERLVDRRKDKVFEH